MRSNVYHLAGHAPHYETRNACLVRMAELYDDSAILTLDSDFLIYRKYGRQPLETIMPVE